MTSIAANSSSYPYPTSTVNYKEQRQQYQLDRQIKECTQFGVAWSPPAPLESDKGEEEEAGRYLFSCLNSGIIACWDTLGGDDDSEEIQEESFSLMGSKRNPIVKIQASQNVLYNIYFYPISSTNQWYLCVCGDDGVFLYKWVVIYGLIQKQHTSTLNRKESNTMLIVELKPFCRYHTVPPSNYDPFPSSYNIHSSASEIEVNSTSIDATQNILFGAAGDVMGSCYQWDIETGKVRGILSTNNSKTSSTICLSKGHTDFLHSVSVVPGGKGHVVTGGEDGNIGLWDAKQNKLIDMIHCGDFLVPRKSSSSRNNMRLGKQTGWVSGIHVEEDGGMAAFCGGLENSSGSSSMEGSNTNGGFVALWHLPTRSILASHKTREEVQSIHFHPSWDSLITVANENVVSYWSWSLQSRQERVWCSSHSCFGLAVNQCQTSSSAGNGMLAVCGASNIVDCYSSMGNRCFGLSFR